MGARQCQCSCRQQGKGDSGAEGEEKALTDDGSKALTGSVKSTSVLSGLFRSTSGPGDLFQTWNNSHRSAGTGAGTNPEKASTKGSSHHSGGHPVSPRPAPVDGGTPKIESGAGQKEEKEGGESDSRTSSPRRRDLEKMTQKMRRRFRKSGSMDALAELVKQPSLLLGVMIENPKDIHSLYDVDDGILGKGSYGAVRKATVKVTGATRAVKCIIKGGENSKQQIRAKEEVQITKRLDHPNIVKLYEQFEDETHIYIVLELCMGGNLYRRVWGVGNLTEASASKVMIQLFRAVYYLHKKHVAHRDIKPENCLLVTDRLLEANNLRVSDFGLSATFEAEEVFTRRVGTQKFMAPEVIDKHYTCTCDVWSCGVTMFYILCGYMPFTGKTDEEIKSKIKIGKLQFNASDWAHVAGDTISLLHQLLVVKPQNRVTLIEALNHSWIKRYNIDCNTGAVDAPWVLLVSNLLHFRSLNKLKRTALHIIASMEDEDTVDQIRQAFVAIDTNHDGELSVQELTKCLAGNCSMQEIETSLAGKLFRLDTDAGIDQRGFTYTEVLAASLDKDKACKEESCWAAFVILDANNDGKISVSELSELNVLGKLSEKELKELVDLFDQNLDGEIDYEEFKSMMRQNEGGLPSPFGGSPRSSASPSPERDRDRRWDLLSRSTSTLHSSPSASGKLKMARTHSSLNSKTVSLASSQKTPPTTTPPQSDGLPMVKEEKKRRNSITQLVEWGKTMGKEKRDSFKRTSISSNKGENSSTPEKDWGESSSTPSVSPKRRNSITQLVQWGSSMGAAVGKEVKRRNSITKAPSQTDTLR